MWMSLTKSADRIKTQHDNVLKYLEHMSKETVVGAMAKLMLLKRNSRHTEIYWWALYFVVLFAKGFDIFFNQSHNLHNSIPLHKHKWSLTLPYTAFWITFMLYSITNSLAAKTVNICLFQLCINHFPGVLHWIYELLGTGRFYYSIHFCSYTALHVYANLYLNMSGSNNGDCHWYPIFKVYLNPRKQM